MRIRKIGAIEHDHTIAAGGQFVQPRVAAAFRNPRIDHFDDDVDELEILADLAHRAHHVSGVPLDDSFEIGAHKAPTDPGGHTPASARPIRRSSETGPKKRESSLSARLSPSTKTLPAGTTTSGKLRWSGKCT